MECNGGIVIMPIPLVSMDAINTKFIMICKLYANWQYDYW